MNNLLSENQAIFLFLIGFIIGVYGFCESRMVFLGGFIIWGIGFISMVCQDGGAVK